MKAAIASLNKRIILKERSIRALEAITFRQWLLATGKFTVVDFVSTQTRDPTEKVDYYKDASVTSLNEYQCVFLHNDTDNFIGGAIGKHTIKQIKELCQFKGNVYYLYTDPNLHLLNMAKIIYDRQVRGTKTEYNTNLRITEEETRVFGNLSWRVLWSGRDFDLYQRHEYTRVKPSQSCKIERYTNIEFFKFMFSHRKVNLNALSLHERPFDLVYYGNWRPKRQNKLRRYLDNDLRKRILGFDAKKMELSNTEYLGYTEPELLAGLVNEAVASIVIGDPSHNNNITTARFYENILFEVCSFIDLDYDPDRTLYKSDFLKEFMYVSSGKELCEKIIAIRRDEELFKSIINQQKEEL